MTPRSGRRWSAQLGLQGMAIPAEYGGAGYGYLELGIILEEMGAALLCAPFFASIAPSTAAQRGRAVEGWLPDRLGGRWPRSTSSRGGISASRSRPLAVPTTAGPSRHRVRARRPGRQPGILVTARHDAGEERRAQQRGAHLLEDDAEFEVAVDRPRRTRPGSPCLQPEAARSSAPRPRGHSPCRSTSACAPRPRPDFASEEAAHYRAQLSLLVVEREIHCICPCLAVAASIRYRTKLVQRLARPIP